MHFTSKGDSFLMVNYRGEKAVPTTVSATAAILVPEKLLPMLLAPSDQPLPVERRAKWYVVPLDRLS